MDSQWPVTTSRWMRSLDSLLPTVPATLTGDLSLETDGPRRPAAAAARALAPPLQGRAAARPAVTTTSTAKVMKQVAQMSMSTVPGTQKTITQMKGSRQFCSMERGPDGVVRGGCIHEVYDPQLRRWVPASARPPRESAARPLPAPTHGGPSASLSVPSTLAAQTYAMLPPGASLAALPQQRVTWATGPMRATGSALPNVVTGTAATRSFRPAQWMF
jgi:hypothetical protein